MSEKNKFLTCDILNYVKKAKTIRVPSYLEEHFPIVFGTERLSNIAVLGLSAYSVDKTTKIR